MKLSLISAAVATLAFSAGCGVSAEDKKPEAPPPAEPAPP